MQKLLQMETCSVLIQTRNLIKSDSCHTFNITDNLINKKLPNNPISNGELID